MAGLDFNFDPFGSRDPLESVGLGSGRAPRRVRPEYRQPLDPEEFKSVGQRAIDTGASGLSYILGTLDKPGQAARGVLAGNGVSALKHLVPFSDSMGLTTEADHVSGRDLTDKLGITTKGDQGWGAWGLGLAADIATDPLTYTTFGAKHALTEAGKAVQKTGALKGWTGRAMLEGFQGVEPTLAAAGKTASDISHLVDQGKRIASQEAFDAVSKVGLPTLEAGQPLSGLVRVGIPFGPQATFGTGQTAQRIAGALDTAGDYLKFGNPVGRAVGSLFDNTRHGAVDKITQRGAVKYMEPSLQKLKRQARTDRFGVIKELDPLVSAGVHDERTINDAARAVAEGVPHQYDPTLAAQLGPVASHIGGVNSRMLGEVRAAGGPIKDVDDLYAKYVHRSAFPEQPRDLQVGGKSDNMLPVTSGANIGRDPVFRDIPGGSNRINNWMDRYAGLGKKQIPTIATAVRKDLEADLIAGGGTMTAALAKQFDDKAIDMATRVAHSNPAYRSTVDQAGKPFFTPDLTADVTQRGAQHARTVSSANTAIGILGDVAQRMQVGTDMVPLPVALKKLGLKTYAADQAAGTPMEGALVQMYRALAKQGAGKVDPFLMGKTKALRNQVGQFGVSREHFDQLNKAYGKWSAPEQIKSSLGAIDSVTNAFKALAYPIWIPAHVRNAFTAATNNAREGVGLRDYFDQLKVMTGRGSRDLSGIHPSLAGLSPADQVNKLREMQYASGNIFGGHGMNDEIAGNVKQALDNGTRFTPQVPGSDRAGPHGNLAADTADLVLKQGLLGSLGATAQSAMNSFRDPLAFAPWNWGSGRVAQALAPLGIKGVGGAASDALPAVAAGRKAGTNIEDFFRGAQWNRQVRSGSTPEVASDAVNRLHFDYDALTGFEKNVMRRLVPFYTFARRNLPLQVDTALHTPGVINAQYKPFNQEDPAGKGYVPQYLASGVAIPTGPEVDGKRQYISKLGLPAEEAFERLHFSGGLPDVRRTALDYMGQLNPLLKAPLEQLFNTQFHTQRKLSDLKAPQSASAIGRVFGDDNPQLLGQIMSNSPLTRFFTSADKLTDPRKSLGQKLLNLGTGVRVTDVDVEKQRAIDTRNALEELLRAHPNLSQYSSFYVKPEDAAKLSPQEIELMRAYATQQEAAREYASQKRERIGFR